MTIEVNVDQDKILDNLRTSEIVDYLKNNSTLKDVLCTWFKVSRGISEEHIIELVEEWLL